MTRIKYSDWGSDVDSTTDIIVPFCIAEQSAITKWQDEDTASSETLKLKARAYATSATDEATIDIRLDSPATGCVGTIEAGYHATPEWTDYAEMLLYPHHPHETDNVSVHSIVPYFPGGVYVGQPASYTGRPAFYGVEVCSYYDDATYDGENMELADYTAGVAYQDDQPASSWVLTRLGVDAYMCILYYATVKIGVAIAPKL